MTYKPKIARILVNLSLNKHFDYLIPEKLENKLHIGSYVKVPFGRNNNRIINGCIVSIRETSSFKNLKYIHSTHDSELRLPKQLVLLGEWMAEYYCCSREQAVRALLPGVIRGGKISPKKIIHVFLPDPKLATEYLFSKCNKAKSRAEIIKILLEKPDIPLSLLLKKSKSNASAVNTLVKHGIIIKEERHVERDPFDFDLVKEAEIPILTDEQNIAVNTISDMIEGKSKHTTALLYGVTGSGKTEVYLRAIKKCIAIEKEAIILVPEISLTPQTTERFRNRFGNEVSVLHSGLSDGERFDEWMKIYEGKVKIVVGARSALFAPFRNLGLIIVDEEHENSYKQDEAPRYHARDVAVMRAFQEKAVAILGSATPSLESFYNAKKDKYELITLSKRIDDLEMPKVNIVDMRSETLEKGGGLFSALLRDSIYNRLNKSEQVILFLNRRGFATYLSCPHCHEYVATCPDCSISYTYHKSKGCLSCHICGSVIPAPTICPNCNSPEIKYSGTGTEKIEEITSKLFPFAKVKRMDSDTMINRKSYEKTLMSFRKGEIDILIGTQMIAKGLDFPNVTLVGVINADTALNLPDFRASERTFQLLTQVAGRAGRGIIPGEVYIQTCAPFNSAIQYAVKHDFENFYIEEIDVREQLEYPPSGHLVVIKFSSESEEKVSEYSEKIFNEIGIVINNEKTMLSPPCPSPISKIKNKYRYAIMIRGFISKGLKMHLRNLLFNKYRQNQVNIQVDVDAVNLM